MFTFSSPDEVVARLEFLEDDKLGTFDQLLRVSQLKWHGQQPVCAARVEIALHATPPPAMACQMC